MQQPGTAIPNPPGKPLVLFDGDCAFCRRWAARWKARTLDAVDYDCYQSAAARFPQVPLADFESATTLIDTDGSVTHGAGAIFRALAHGGFRPWLDRAYVRIPLFAALADASYRVVSNNRPTADRVDRFLFGKTVAPSRYVLCRWLFLRLLGVIFLIAFVSLWLQIDGLIGSHGIAPVKPFLESISREHGRHGYYLLPTLLWINASDQALHLLCGAGVAASCMLIVGLAPVVCLVTLWACYLSLTTAGQTFLAFQWDNLLIETGFLAVFLAPMEWALWRAPARPPSALALFLLRWLLFRVMFMSGVVKIASHDPSWRARTAMQFHYFTQPLPAWTSWYFHHLPAQFQSMSVGVTFVAELVAPVLIFGPRRLRRMAFWIIVLFQLLILLSGNFGFFNLLAIALCFTLVDDGSWPKRVRAAFAARERSASWKWPAPVLVPVAVLVLAITSVQLVDSFGNDVPLPKMMGRAGERIGAFRTINSYGLFAVMTVRRPEIIIEGSDDGVDWKPYEFKWKPGDVMRRPAFATPHMPRLDWQMWFASLGAVENNRWLVYFVGRLLEGSPPVLALLERDPFNGRPPRYVRAITYEYAFTDAQQRAASGAWWTRTPVRIYLPPVDLTFLRRAMGKRFPDE